MYAAAVPPSLQDRITAAAALTNHSVEALLSHLGDVTRSLSEVEVATNGDATAIAVTISLVGDQHRDQRLKNLANAISGSDALALSATGRASRVMRIERGIGPQGRPTRGLAGVFSSVYHLEPRPLEADLEIARAVGIPAATCAELSARMKKLGSPVTTLRVTVYSGPAGEDFQVELAAPALPDVFVRLDDTGEPSRFLRALAPGGSMLVWNGATPKGLVPTRVEYLQPDFEEAIAIAGKFGEMSRVQSFVAALESRTIASVAVSLAPTPLGSAWLSASAS